ncbi:MAG: YkvA family protein [Candidatus Kapaibacterium sp.]|jgi:uncharacterized membrane protein YkvA (DUF1232 family)|nr:YkvA family protein [Candidatus Kapabacteria bacterium]
MTQKSVRYSKNYSEKSFHKKLTFFAGSLSAGFLTKAVTLWYSMRDKDTPTWAKSIILGALGYFIIPLDSIPDIMPIIGFSDDLTAFVSAAAIVWSYIKPEHEENAKKTVRKIIRKP